MRVLIIILLSLPLMALAETFIDQVDGDVALVCSNESNNWVCKSVPVEFVNKSGTFIIEGAILTEEEIDVYNESCGC